MKLIFSKFKIFLCFSKMLIRMEKDILKNMSTVNLPLLLIWKEFTIFYGVSNWQIFLFHFHFTVNLLNPEEQFEEGKMKNIVFIQNYFRTSSEKFRIFSPKEPYIFRWKNHSLNFGGKKFTSRNVNGHRFQRERNWQTSGKKIWVDNFAFIL